MRHRLYSWRFSSRYSWRYYWRDELPGAFVHGFAVLCGLAALSVFAAWVVETPPAKSSVPAPQVSSASQWTKIERPYPAFALTIPEAADAPSTYAIHRHVQGGRKDILTLGERAGSAPYLHVEVYRPGGEAARFGDAASEIIAQAALGAAEVAAGDAPVDTKFGSVSVARFVLEQVDGGTPRNCVGFARNYEEPRLQIFGWFCQRGSDVERSTLACALDRFTLLAAGSEPKVSALFAQAELHRSFCGQRSPLMTPTPRHRDLWNAISNKSADTAEPKLRKVLR